MTATHSIAPSVGSALDGTARWTTAKIGEVCHVNPPKPKRGTVQPDLPVSFVPMPAVDADAGAITQPVDRPYAEVAKGFTAFRDGDVIMAKITPCMENGKAAIACGLTNGLGFGSTEFHVLRPTDRVRAEYVYYFIRQESFRQAAEMEMTGSVGQKRVPADYIENAEIPLPSLAEQKRIVEAIERLTARVDAARARLAAVPAILKRFRQAVLAAACSGRLTEDWRNDNPHIEPAHTGLSLFDNSRKQRKGKATKPEAGELDLESMPDLPETWVYRRADTIVAPDTIITYGIILPGPEVSGGVPYVRQQDIQDGGILVEQLRRTTPDIAAKHSRSVLAEGDVLLCIIRHLRVATVPSGLDGANLTQGTVRMRPSTVITGPYLARFLASQHAQAWMKQRHFGMSMPRINVEHARAIPVAVPPMAEQAEIVRRVDSLMKLADVIERRVATAHARADKLTQSVLAKAFCGELANNPCNLSRANHTVAGAAEAPTPRLSSNISQPTHRRGNPIRSPGRTGRQ